MITKALIKKTADLKDNHFLIYIPLLRKANAPEESAYLSATAIVFPGAENMYNVDDVVYVGFEDNLADKPVILGKLYTGKETKESIATTLTVKSVEATETAQLPASTSINGLGINELYKRLNWILSNNYLPAITDENDNLVADSDVIVYTNEATSTLKTVKEALDYLIAKSE